MQRYRDQFQSILNLAYTHTSGVSAVATRRLTSYQYQMLD